MTTVLTHVFNEEVLLPYWLEHHKRLFDHGIVLDQNSTDRSLEIIRDICPHWKVITGDTSNAREIDLKLMQLETQVKGWKICLCTTEFIVRPELHTYLESINPQLMGVRTQGYVIIETPEERTRNLDNRNLLLQRTHGYPEVIAPVTTILERSRLLHRYPTGAYLGGRHTSEHDASCPIDPNLPLAWFGWGLPDIKKRKNQALRDRFKKIIHLPLSPRKYAWVNGFGQHHCHSDEEIEDNWQEQLKIAENLMNYPQYNAQLLKIQEHYSVSVEGT